MDTEIIVENNDNNNKYNNILSFLKYKTLNNDIKWKDRPIRSHHVSMIINKKKIINHTLCENDGNRTCISGKFVPCSIHAEYKTIYSLVNNMPELKSLSDFINPFHCHKIRLSPKQRRILNKMDIIVVRFNAHDVLSDSRPCCFCSKLIHILNFNRCIYSINHNTLESVKSQDLIIGDKTSGYKRFIKKEKLKYRNNYK